MMDVFFILLVVLYLMFEENDHPEGSLRYLIDRQIQQYIGLKTLLSAVMGIVVFIILGPILHIELAHLVSSHVFIVRDDELTYMYAYI